MSYDAWQGRMRVAVVMMWPAPPLPPLPRVPPSEEEARSCGPWALPRSHASRCLSLAVSLPCLVTACCFHALHNLMSLALEVPEVRAEDGMEQW